MSELEVSLPWLLGAGGAVTMFLMTLYGILSLRMMKIPEKYMSKKDCVHTKISSDEAIQAMESRLGARMDRAFQARLQFETTISKDVKALDKTVTALVHVVNGSKLPNLKGE